MNDRNFHAVDREDRTCFGIAYFASKKDADNYSKYVRENGRTYNGGMMSGKPCGRAPEFDRSVAGEKQYAVTD